jgi:mono/diheme cytochrome c family protein
MIPCKTLPAALLIAALSFSAFAFFHSRTADVEAGRALYVQHCADCHGVNLEGQQDWRSPDANGLYTAPPHDESGHTWHHDDAMLIDYITRGGQAVLEDMGVDYISGMPGFAEVLKAGEIEAILASGMWFASCAVPNGPRTSCYPQRRGRIYFRSMPKIQFLTAWLWRLCRKLQSAAGSLLLPKPVQQLQDPVAGWVAWQEYEPVGRCWQANVRKPHQLLRSQKAGHQNFGRQNRTLSSHRRLYGVNLL